MTKVHLTQVWQWLSIACVLFLVTSVISIQGGSEFLGRLFGDKAGDANNKPAIGYFGAIVGGGLFLFASLAFLLHARRHGDRWHSRIPVVWLENLRTQAWEAQVFQICVILVFVAAPIAGIIHCMGEAESGDICEYKTNNRYTGAATTLAWPPVAKEGRQMRLRRSGADTAECNDGIELFPRSLTPLGFYVVPIAAMGLALTALGFVVLRRSAPSRADT